MVLETIDTRNRREVVFFTELGCVLRAADTEIELLEFVLTLSTTAFRGFNFSETTLQSVGRLLLEAEEISTVFGAPVDRQH